MSVTGFIPKCVHAHSGLLPHFPGLQLHAGALPAGGRRLRHPRNHRLPERDPDQGHFQNADTYC